MKFPIYIAKRYLFTRSSNNAINIISIIAALGVVVGSAALLIVLSGFAGLKDFTLEFSSFVDPDLKVLPAKGKFFDLSQREIDEINGVDEIASFSKIIEERVVINYETKSEIVTLKGVDENFPRFTIDSILVQGHWFDDNLNQIVTGWGVSNNLSLGVFEFDKTVEIYVPKPGKGQITSLNGAYNSISAVNSGVFQINEDLDYSNVFTHIETAMLLLGYSNDQISSIEVFVKDPDNAEMVSERLQSIINADVIIKDRLQLNDALYKMLNAENLAVYLIFTLVLIIALFNVIGSIIMMILEKKSNLNTLMSLGLTIPEIRQIFFYQGSLMTILGGLLGLFLGTVLLLLQKTFGWVPITPSLPYPVSIKSINFIIVLATISLLGILAAKIASSRISKQLVRGN